MITCLTGRGEEEVFMSSFIIIMSCPSSTGFSTGHTWSFLSIPFGSGSLKHVHDFQSGAFSFMLCYVHLKEVVDQLVVDEEVVDHHIFFSFVKTVD